MLILGAWGGKNDRRRVPADGAMATVRPRPHLSLRLIQFRKLLRHGQVVPGQALDGQVLGLVVGKAEIVFGGLAGIVFREKERAFLFSPTPPLDFCLIPTILL